MPCPHPGQILLQHYLEPNRLSQNALARAIMVPPRRINEIILQKRSITADTAIRLAHYFGNSASDWMRLQTEYDIEQVRAKIQIQLNTIRPPERETAAVAETTAQKKVSAPDMTPGTRVRRRIMR